MSTRAQENLIAGALLIFFGGYSLVCLGFGPNARLVPLPMAIVGFLLVVGHLLNVNLRPAQVNDDDNDRDVTASGTRGSRELQAFGGAVALILLIVVLGPVVAVFLFSCGYLLLTRHATPGRALVAGSLFTAIIYLLFVVGLQLQLYHGILEPIFGRY